MSVSPQATAIDIALEEWTPRGPFSCADFFLAEVEPLPRLLLVDGIGVPDSQKGRPPRVRFAEVLRAAWPEMRAAAAGAALAILGQQLRAASTGDDGAALFASAALCVRRPGRDGWEVAEVGDTRVFLDGNLVHPEPLVPEEHRITGPLGVEEPLIRARIVQVKAGESFSLLSDGAWRVLVRLGRLDRRAARLSGAALEDFSRSKFEADDDATFARCTLGHP